MLGAAAHVIEPETSIITRTSSISSSVTSATSDASVAAFTRSSLMYSLMFFRTSEIIAFHWASRTLISVELSLPLLICLINSYGAKTPPLTFSSPASRISRACTLSGLSGNLFPVSCSQDSSFALVSLSHAFLCFIRNPEGALLGTIWLQRPEHVLTSQISHTLLSRVNEERASFWYLLCKEGILDVEYIFSSTGWYFHLINIFLSCCFWKLIIVSVSLL